jgi:hypothetical protein
MKRLITVMALGLSVSAYSQAWKTLPANVRILGYRNVTTSKVKSNYNQFRSEASLGTTIRLDAATLNDMAGNIIVPGQDISAEAYNNFLLGEYTVDPTAQFNVNGFGLGWGITNRVMAYAEFSYYSASVKTKLRRTKGNTYGQTADGLHNNNNGVTDSTVADNLKNLPDVDAGVIQSALVNEMGYKPLGNWTGKGYGDMETGVMINVADYGVWGLLLYPGVVLPTGRTDDPDMLQDVGFGDGQTDFFLEAATGYVFNDYLTFGTTLRGTYQQAFDTELRVPSTQNSTVSYDKGEFNVKYGNKINWMANATYSYNDWLAFTPVYRLMYQTESQYESKYEKADQWLSSNSDKMEHQVQLTTSISTIQPFLKKKFLLPAQINMNVVQTVGGKNVPKVGRFEVELRMLF